MNSVTNIARKVASRAKRMMKGDSASFLKGTKGVVHIGANSGQEKETYARYKLDVVWVEPIPEVFQRLEQGLANYPRQRAFQRLMTDKDDEAYKFHVSNTEGVSSSILKMELHKEMWPSVDYEREIDLQSVTLDTFIEHENIDASQYDVLILDTQGSELLILQGSIKSLNHFQLIKVEAPDFESYKNCCQVTDLKEFLEQHGFQESQREEFMSTLGIGSYYDVTFKRVV